MKALFVGLDAATAGKFEAKLREEGYTEFEAVEEIKCARKKLESKSSKITQVGVRGTCCTPARALEIFSHFDDLISHWKKESVPNR